MGRPATPTLPRILLACALVAWLAFATTAGFSAQSVWAGGGVGLAVLAIVEALRRRRSLPGALARAPQLALPGLPASGLLQPFSPLPPARSLMPAMISRIDLPSRDAGKSFARLVPFGDAREVIVRRGEAMGRQYGLEQGRRLVAIAGQELLLVRYTTLLSPPVLRPGEAKMSPEAARSYQPESDVLYLPDAEVLIRREPRGFSDAEVARIVAAISLSPPSPSPATSEDAANESPELAMARLRARSSTSYELKKAIGVVGVSGPSGAVPLLLGYLRNTDLTVVEAACFALSRLGAREAIADLLDMLRPEAEAERNIDCTGDPYGWYEAPPRASALLALTAMRVLEAEPAVRRLLSDADIEVQRLARHYFEALGLNIER